MGKSLQSLIIGLCVIGILSICSTVAANDSSFDKVFSSAEGITPPTAPPGETVGVPNPDIQPIRLLLVNSGNGSTISSVHVIIELNSTYKTLSYVGPSGVLDLPVPKGAYTITLKVDDITTPGGDYYTIETANLVNTTEIRLFLVGSAGGSVRYKETLVRNAQVSFSCSGLYGDTGAVETDDYGTFLAQWLPLGQCTIRATDGKKAGFATVTITSGNLEEVTIVLERDVSSSPYLYIALAICAIFALLFLLHRIMLSRRKKPGVSKESAKEKPIPKESYPKRLSDVSKTLSKKERDIIDIIYKEKEVTQAKIVYSLLLPKTTVIRLLSSMEGKGIVTIQKYGKAKKIRLTDWILGKTEKKD